MKNIFHAYYTDVRTLAVPHYRESRFHRNTRSKAGPWQKAKSIPYPFNKEFCERLDVQSWRRGVSLHQQWHVWYVSLYHIQMQQWKWLIKSNLRSCDLRLCNPRLTATLNKLMLITSLFVWIQKFLMESILGKKLKSEVTCFDVSLYTLWAWFSNYWRYVPCHF